MPRSSLRPSARWVWLAIAAPLLSALPPAAAQVLEDGAALEPWRLTSYVEEAGVGDSWIWDLAFEADGTVWMAGTAGLLSFDGYTWDRYGSADGLPSDFVRCVEVTAAGTLWVGTDLGAGTFDGERFDSAGSAGRLAGPSVRRIVEDSRGALWFCCDSWPEPGVSCGLTLLDAGEWTSYGVSDGLPNAYIYDVFEQQDGRSEGTPTLWVLTREGLARREGQRFRAPLVEAGLEDPRQAIWSMTEDNTGALIAVGTRSMFVRVKGIWEARPLPGAPGQPRLSRMRDGTVMTANQVDGMGFFTLEQDGLEPASARIPSEYASVETVAEAPDGSVWAVGHRMLLRWEREPREWEFFPGLAAPTLVDPRGGVWLSGLRDASVARVHQGRIRELPEARGSVQADSNGAVWARTEDGMMRCSVGVGEELTTELVPIDHLGLGRPRFFAIARDGPLWVAGDDPAGRDRLALRDANGWRVADLGIVGADELLHELWSDEVSGVWARIVSRSDGPTRVAWLESSDGSPGMAVRKQVTLPAQLQRSDRPQVVSDPYGTLWAHGTQGMFRQAEGTNTWSELEGLPGNHVFRVTLVEGELWAFCMPSSGGESGAVQLDLSGRILRVVLGAQSEVRDPGGRVRYLRTHSDLLSLEEDSEELRSVEMPLTVRLGSALLDRQGALWIGTSSGVLRHLADGIAPRVSAPDVLEDVLAERSWILPVAGIERFRRGPTARSFRYAIRIDGEGWSPMRRLSPGGIPMGAQPPGRHRLEVLVEDQSGDIAASPAVFSFLTRPIPLQDRPWFLPAVVLIGLALGVLSVTSARASRRVGRQAAALEGLVVVREDELAVSERKYRGLFEQSRDAVLLIDRELCLQDANPSGRQLLGLDPEASAGVPLPTLMDAASGAALAEACRSGRPPRELASSMLSRRGHVIDALLTVSPRGSGDGFQVNLRDVTQQRRMERKLQEQKRQLEMAVAGSGGGQWIATFGQEDPHGDPLELVISGAILGRLGLDPAVVEVTPDWWLGRVHPDDRELLRSTASDCMRSGGPDYRIEYRVFHEDGSLRWIRSSGRAVVQGDMRPNKLTGIHWDVTDVKREEERRELFVRELDHRVKNTLATVLAIAQQTIDSADDLEEFATAYQGRIAALARVHETLARRGWDGALLGDVVQRCLEPYRSRLGRRVHVEGPDVKLPVSAVSAISMTLHELSTNAAKYGALSASEGELSVDWAVRREGEESLVELDWLERGGPPVPVSPPAGFGTSLIRKGVEYELGGEVELDLEPAGLHCRIRLTV